MKQAVIAPSMPMLLYPLDDEVDGYPRDQFLTDLCDETERDIRQAFGAGAKRVSIDFTEGRLAQKSDRRLRLLAVQHRRQAQAPPRHGSPDFACDVAFQKITNRVRGVALASEQLGL